MISESSFVPEESSLIIPSARMITFGIAGTSLSVFIKSKGVFSSIILIPAGVF